MKSSDGRFEYLNLAYEQLPDGSLPEKVERFGFRCPKNNMCSGLLVRGRGNDAPNKTWIWDGNVDEPTFSPSINCQGCSHGYIEKGKWRDA